MGNLGSTDTPAAVQSLELPEGYGIDVENGNFIVTDPNGAVVFRWDDTAGEWQLAATLDADGNDLTNVGAIDADSATVGNRWAREQATPQVAAPHATTEDLEIWVDTAGDDSNDGTETSPVRTLNEAMSRVPKNLYHNVTIYVNDGDYSADGVWYVVNHHGQAFGEDTLKIVGHHPDHPNHSDTLPENVVIPTMNVAATWGWGNEGVRIHGVEFDGGINAKTSQVIAQDCRFTGGQLGDGRLCRGYGYLLELHRCHFFDNNTGSPGDIVTSGKGATTLIKDCTASNVGRVGDIRESILMIRRSQSVIDNADAGPRLNDRASRVFTDSDSMPSGTSIAAMETGDNFHRYYGAQAIWNLQSRMLLRSGDFELGDRGASISFRGGGSHAISASRSGLRIVMNDNDGSAKFNAPIGVRLGDGYGDPDAEDLSSVSGDFVGQTKMNDGTTGSQGPHWWDGSAWNQMSDWGQTITPA